MFRDPPAPQNHRPDPGAQPRPAPAAQPRPAPAAQPRPVPAAQPPSVAVARCCIDAYNRRDVEALRTLAHPDVEIDWSQSRSLRAGRYSGIDEVLRFYADDFEMFEAVTVEPEHLIEVGHSVVIPNVTRLRGREGIEVAARSTLALTVIDGKLRHVRLFQAPL